MVGEFYRGEMANRVYSPEPTDEGLENIVPKIGNSLTLSGVLFQGMDENVLLLFPEADLTLSPLESKRLSPGQWATVLEQSDDPIIFEHDSSGVIKPFIRKAQYTISGDVQQKIWVRDNCQCVYCGAKMGKATLTIDHFMPLELGGQNNPKNYLTACRNCNKAKGNMHPEKWCRKRGYNYQHFVEYLNESF